MRDEYKKDMKFLTDRLCVAPLDFIAVYEEMREEEIRQLREEQKSRSRLRKEAWMQMFVNGAGI